LPRPEWEDDELEAEFAVVQNVIRGIREIRALHGIPPGKKVVALFKTSGRSAAILGRLRGFIAHIAALESIEIGPDLDRPAAAVGQVIGDIEVYLAGVIDPAKERERMEALRRKLGEDVQRAEKKLGNESFLSRAPADIVEKEKQKLKDLKGQIELIEANLKTL
jgi:valyl-tRNA synthetase